MWKISANFKVCLVLTLLAKAPGIIIPGNRESNFDQESTGNFFFCRFLSVEKFPVQPTRNSPGNNNSW